MHRRRRLPRCGLPGALHAMPEAAERPPACTCVHRLAPHCALSLTPHNHLQGTALSAMQARDSGGRWVDVQLAHNEVAVLLGHTLQHATAGLLRPATHRVVGQPFGAPGGGAGLWGAGHGRRLLHFELRPRPAAVLDLRAQLAVSGHQVSAR